MTNLTEAPDHRTKHKLTAAQVEEGCPALLQDLGKRIAVHLDKARKCQEKAKQHYTAIAQHPRQRKLATTTALMRSGKSFSRTWAGRAFMSCFQSRPAKSRSNKSAPTPASALQGHERTKRPRRPLQ